MKRKYYSIRVVWAESEEEAIEQLCEGRIDITNPICDKVIDFEEIMQEIYRAESAEYPSEFFEQFDNIYKNN